MRLNFPYIGPDDELVVLINMRGIPERYEDFANQFLTWPSSLLTVLPEQDHLFLTLFAILE
jgi:hypothetical protein